MQQRKPYAWAVLVLGLLLAALHTADLLLWCEPGTGFATVGSPWWRMAPWLLALLLPYLAARAAAPQPAAMADTCPPLGAAMLATGLLLVGTALGVWAGWITWTAPFTITAMVQRVTVVLALLAGLWLLFYGVRAFGGYGVQRKQVGSALFAVVVPLYFVWRLVAQFEFAPAAVVRLPNTLRVVMAVAAVLFATLLLKIFLVPGLPCGKSLFAAGSGCFLLCTCHGLPQLVVEALQTGPTLAALPDLAAAALGLGGLYCAFAAMGPGVD